MFVFDRAGHQHMVVALAPFDGKVAAWQRDRHLAAGAREPRGGDSRSAGRGAAGLGEAGAALPGADHDAIARRRCGERDVGPLRKQRMVLELRPDPGEIVRVWLFNPEYRVRIAHVHHGRGAQEQRAGCGELQIDRAGVGHRGRQRNFVPAKARRAHIDGEQAIR